MTAVKTPRRRASKGVGATIDLFELESLDNLAPDIRTPAPSSPGSESSRAGARNVAPRQRNQLDRILREMLDRDEPVSREHLVALTGIRESSMCGRLAALEPTWVQKVESACRSRAGVRVNGYLLTAAGRRRARGAS